jgi:magnesium-transporting ATPase (P-type)
VIRLCAGDLVPADARLLTARDLHVQQAALTGESLPAEKEAQSSRAEGPLRPENRFPLGFVPLPAEYLALVALGTLLYLVLAELAKRLLLRRAIGES